MRDKQKALNLIEQSLLLFRELAEENPPLDYLEWNDRQHAAGKPLDEAHTLWMNMKGRDQAEVRNAWAGAHVQIERMLAAEGSADEPSDEKYQPVETHGVGSASSDRRKALELIEAAFQGYRSLLERPPQHDEDYRERKGKADAQQAQADIIMRGMLQDYRTVVDAFGHANYEMEVMAGIFGGPGSDADEYLEASEYLDFTRMDEVEEEEPADPLDVDDRAESSLANKQKALDLIEQSLQGYRALMEDRPVEYDDYTRRRHRADDLLDQADSRVRSLTGNDWSEAAAVFRQANDDIVRMIRQIGSPQMDDHAEEPDKPDDDDGVEAEMDATERAEMYSTLVHDPFDGEPDDDRPENQD